ncbi:DUF2461 domain-containing protein [Terriglobus aquaticus]|uniref:DUF2461 domain-containing protein n=1 Tax=Terriglobus aquaticus TaxID=940139 RepID=A0ABW9KP66_9BACT|nr:DUF2461 domain-containing protein [Terriglobus aquaticus]
MPQVPPHLSAAAIRFLQHLQRNNDRDWFNARKDLFTHEVQDPWLAVLEAVNQRLAEFAPDYVRPARRAAMRIYRDIRFSKDKRPYKTNIAAWWSTTTTERTNGGGFYVHVSHQDVVVAAGVYMPSPAQLLLIRRHLQQHHAELRGMLNSSKIRKLMPELDSNPLRRMPKGFLPDDPAADLLLCRQWALSAKLPLEVATSPKLVNEIAKRFRAVAPMVALLNAPLLAGRAPRKSLF